MPEADQRSRAQVFPITDDDLAEVGRLLAAHFPPATAAAEWADAWRRSVNLPGSGAPNHGFLLRAGGEVVGAYLAIYSTRVIAGRTERFCSLAVWFVRPEHRIHSVRMAQAMVGQPGFHFTDLAPIPLVQKLNLRLGFRYLKTDTTLAPNLPWPTVPGRTRVSADPAVLDATLTGETRRIYRDHAACRWARHAVLIRGDRWCYVQWRREARKNLPLFAAVQYASHPDLLREAFRPFTRYLLVRHRALFTLAEVRVVGGRPRPSVLLADHRPRMFKSATLASTEIDYLYSEITAAP